MYLRGIDGLFYTLAFLIAFFATAAIFGWVPAFWTACSLVLAGFIRYGWRD